MVACFFQHGFDQMENFAHLFLLSVALEMGIIQVAKRASCGKDIQLAKITGELCVGKSAQNKN